MWHQTLQRTLRRSPLASVWDPCAVCTCRCGAILRSNGSSRRSAQTRRAAPSTHDRERRQQSRPISPEEVRKETLDRERYKDALLTRLHALKRANVIKLSPDVINLFFGDFDVLVKRSQGRPTADPVVFQQLLNHYDLSHKDAFELIDSLLRLSSDAGREIQYVCKKMSLTLSRLGLVDATIQVMGEALLQARKKPSVLSSSELQYAKPHLTKVASEGLDCRAMVLEGKIAQFLGHEERAIELWTAAMGAAVAASESQLTARQDRKSDLQDGKPPDNDKFQLSTPWIELMLIHWQRSMSKGKDEMRQCRWAMEVGCQQDDPTSHYYTATFTRRVNSDGNHIPTSDWLYHMTKAATSGHQKACHELAVFYAQSGWKYIEDEPPDDVKPTVFDSYPAPTARADSFWNNIRTFMGLGSSHKSPDPKHDQFHAAMFPHTAVERYRIAMAWLKIPMKFRYAPSYMFMAQMLMQERLWSGADAPPSALALSTNRYTFASKEDRDANRPIVRSAEIEPEDPPNPFYDPAQARELVTEVFYALHANEVFGVTRSRYASLRRRGRGEAVLDEDYVVSESFMEVLDSPSTVTVWARYPDVRAMYEDQLDALRQEAEAMCDEHGWDLYSDESKPDGLLYRAKRTSKPDGNTAAL